MQPMVGLIYQKKKTKHETVLWVNLPAPWVAYGSDFPRAQLLTIAKDTGFPWKSYGIVQFFPKPEGSWGVVVGVLYL